MKSFTKIQNEKDITVKQYVDEQNATNKIYTTFTPEGGTEGEDYAITVPGLKTLEVGTSLTIKPHVNNKNTSTTLTVNDFGLKYFRRSLSGDYINTSNFTFPANMIKAGFPIKVFYGDNIWLTEQAKPTVSDLSGY